jgi:quercetin dioxygenase-like cupin family protein
LFDTKEFEVAVKKYSKGDVEKPHYHKIAQEITVVISGKIKMLNREWVEDDIIIVEPGEITGFEALDDSITVVVKIPGPSNDKYEVV